MKKELITANSKLTGNTTTFDLKYESKMKGKSFDVFLNRSNGNVVYRSSIKRRYKIVS